MANGWPLGSSVDIEGGAHFPFPGAGPGGVGALRNQVLGCHPGHRRRSQLSWTLPCLGRGLKHQGTPGMLESKQQLAEKHWSLEMPGKPQFNLFLALTREHWQGSAERPWLSQPPGTSGTPQQCHSHPGKGHLILVVFEPASVLQRN